MGDYRLNMAIVNYCARAKYWHTIGSLCERLLRKAGEDPVWRFWHGFSLDQEHESPKALSDFRKCSGRREIALPLHLAELRAHRRCRLVDTEAVSAVEAQIPTDDKTATKPALLQAAAFSWHTGDTAAAHGYLSRCNSDSDEYLDSVVMEGWLTFEKGGDKAIDEALEVFRKALRSTAQDDIRAHIDAAVGVIECLYMKEEFDEALELCHKVVAHVPKFWPGLTMLADLYLAKGSSEQAQEALEKLLQYDGHNVEGQAYNILVHMVHKHDPDTLTMLVSDLASSLETAEPANPSLYAYLARTISRTCGPLPRVLEASLVMIDRGLAIDAEHAGLLCERARHYQQLRRWEDALKDFRAATQSDPGMFEALVGQIRCSIMLGHLDDAATTLEFMKETCRATGRTSEYPWLEALLRWRRFASDPKANLLSLHDKSPVQIALRESVAKLDEAYALLTENEIGTRGVHMFAYYQKFDAAFVVDLVDELLQHCPTTPPEATDPPNFVIKKTLAPLDLVTTKVPGLQAAQYKAATMRFVNGDKEIARHIIRTALEMDSSFAAAHLLAAQIFLHDDSPAGAEQCLEQAVSLNFQVRDWVEYDLLAAAVAKARSDYDVAASSLEHGLMLVEGEDRQPAKEPTLAEKARVYAELAEAYVQYVPPRIDEATALIKKAKELYGETRESGRIQLAQAVVTTKVNVDLAIEQLRAIPSDSRYFLKAKYMTGNLYLVHRNNKRLYAKTFEELVQLAPSPATYRFLGEALIRVQNPDKGVAMLRKAVELAPGDVVNAQALGHGLVVTHAFDEAISFFEKACAADPDRFTLYLDLARLHLRLKKPDEAIEVMTAALAAREQRVLPGEETAYQQDRVQGLHVIVNAQRQRGDNAAALKALNEERAAQMEVVSAVRHDAADTVQRESRRLGEVCYELGVLHKALQKPDRAAAAWTEATKHDENNADAILALARHHLARDELDEAEMLASRLNRIDPSNESAIMLLADILFRRGKQEDAVVFFCRLLERNPTNYEALCGLVDLLRRAGRLEQAPRFFDLVEQSSPRARLDPGLRYSKGLYYKYTGQARAALREFNAGRRPRDAKFSEKCVKQMVELYINPDGENLWQGELKPQQNERVQQALALLPEITHQRTRSLLEGYALASLRRKESLDAALQKFFDVMNAPGACTTTVGMEKIDVPSLVGLCIAQYLAGKKGQVKGQLMKIASAPLTAEDAESFERGWILLADLHIADNKFEVAIDLLKRTLSANKSNGRAWETLGHIYEKEQSYVNAAECYEQSWELLQGADPGIGKLLASNYLKAGKMVQTIDVCHKVLAQFPDYPGIQDDILRPARLCLRS